MKTESANADWSTAAGRVLATVFIGDALNVFKHG